MQIHKMLLAAQAAVDNKEVPTIQQVMLMATALHEMTVRMNEFLWFDKTFEGMSDTAYCAGQSAKCDEVAA